MIIYYLSTPYWEGLPFITEQAAVDYACANDLFCPSINTFDCDCYDFVPVSEHAPGGIIIYINNFNDEDDEDDI